MYLTTVYASAIAAFIGTAYYAVSIIRGKFSPPLSAFIILSASFGIAWFLYTKTPDWSWTSNIGLVVAMINVWAIALTIFFVLCFKKTVLVSFDNTQKWTLAAAFGILLLWAGTDNPFLSYVLLQVLALVGYWPIAKRLYYKTHDDSLFLWVTVWISVIVAIYPAFEQNDVEAYIYIARAVVGTSVLVGLLIRIRWDNSCSE